jgi:atypical dual specificity phosphatase
MAVSAVLQQSAAPLWMSGFGVGFGDRVILSSIDLELPATGLTALMGPAGVGKSTLLRSICGLAQQSANFKCWGDMRHAGLMPGEAGWPSLVVQDARLFIASVRQNLVQGLVERDRMTTAEQARQVHTHLEQLDCLWLEPLFDTPVLELELHQQRMVAILRQTLGAPRLLCVDEPTVGLEDAEAAELLGLLARWSTAYGVLMASHHQHQVRDHADQVALLAGGRIQEQQPTADFFARPMTSYGRDFVERGTCDSPRPDALAEELAEDCEPPPPLSEQARTAMSAWCGPNGFVWLEKGRLAGTPRPGVVSELEHDLDALARVGVTRLLTLLEDPLDCQAALAERGIVAMHVPIDDMAAPTQVQAVGICRQIDQWLDQGEVIAVHCHAGHGRTGTVLAAWRIWRGDGASETVENLRRLERRWIQSLAQAEFLERFEEFLRSK